MSCFGITTVHWSVQYSCDQSGYCRTVTSLQAVSVYVSTLHKVVLKCPDSEQMLSRMIEGCQDWIELGMQIRRAD